VAATLEKMRRAVTYHHLRQSSYFYGVPTIPFELVLAEMEDEYRKHDDSSPDSPVQS
jgi:hypothetical protein